jgi:hypothetical protein
MRRLSQPNRELVAAPAARTHRQADQHEPDGDHDNAEDCVLVMSRHRRSVQLADTLVDKYRANSAQYDPCYAANPHVLASISGRSPPEKRGEAPIGSLAPRRPPRPSDLFFEFARTALRDQLAARTAGSACGGGDCRHDHGCCGVG